MPLFGNYENAGVGIAKDAPRKKPFFRYWELVFRKFWKLIEVNLLLMTSLLPLLGAVLSIYFLAESRTGLCLFLLFVMWAVFAVLSGPVIAGCTQILRCFSLEKPVFMMNMFWKTFRSSFRKSCIMSIIDTVVATSVVCSFYAYPAIVERTGSNMYYILYVITLSLGIAVLMMNYYAYLMIVSTDLSMQNILKNSLALSCVALKTNLITTVIVAVIMGLFALLTVLFPYVMAVVMLFVPTAFVAFAVVCNSYPIIQKYVITPFYAQRGEVNPEMEHSVTPGENVFEDQGGKETPVATKKTGKGKKKKIIS